MLWSLTLRNLPGLLGAVAVSGVIWFSYNWVYDRGYSAHEEEVREATEELQSRLNAVTLENSDLVAEIEEASQNLSNLERRLTDEAREDPRSSDPGLGAGSLRRLNQVR